MRATVENYHLAVSPWQFKNLPSDAWVELSDTLIKYRWEQAINTVKPDIVEIVTWNDYGECQSVPYNHGDTQSDDNAAHYIADINPKVNLGNDAPNYVNGFTHSPWRTIMQ
jgi:glucan endo-1,3-alpha-glucosidase